MTEGPDGATVIAGFPAYEVQVSRRKLLRALLSGRPMRCDGSEVAARRRRRAVREPPPELVAQVRWGLDYAGRTYGPGGTPASGGGVGERARRLADYNRRQRDYIACTLGGRVIIGPGGAGTDPAIPQCPVCMAYGGGGHGGGCPNSGLDPAHWQAAPG